MIIEYHWTRVEILMNFHLSEDFAIMFLIEMRCAIVFKLFIIRLTYLPFAICFHHAKELSSDKLTEYSSNIERGIYNIQRERESGRYNLYTM